MSDDEHEVHDMAWYIADGIKTVLKLIAVGAVGYLAWGFFYG